MAKKEEKKTNNDVKIHRKTSISTTPHKKNRLLECKLSIKEERSLKPAKSTLPINTKSKEKIFITPPMGRKH